VETVKGNVRNVVADVTTTGALDAHTLHIDAEFTFLGTDCSANDAPPSAITHVNAAATEPKTIRERIVSIRRRSDTTINRVTKYD
jgi:hypothetical protein